MANVAEVIQSCCFFSGGIFIHQKALIGLLKKRKKVLPGRDCNAERFSGLMETGMVCSVHLS